MPGIQASALLAIEGLRFGYQPERVVLDLQELQLAAGESLFLRGPSGSGKSTLLNLIAGVLVPQAGSIALLGQSHATLGAGGRDRFRADHIGFVFQQFNLLPYFDAVDNVLLPLSFSPRRRQRVGSAARTQAVELLTRLNLDTREHGRPAVELSVGQQQRVAAARALIGAPELIVADEPTSALDADTRDAFLALLFDECRSVGAGLLFVSHDRSLEARFDRSLDLPTLNRAGASPC
jgi:putative ABC transport system ATP-binding protein